MTSLISLHIRAKSRQPVAAKMRRPLLCLTEFAKRLAAHAADATDCLIFELRAERYEKCYSIAQA